MGSQRLLQVSLYSRASNSLGPAPLVGEVWCRLFVFHLLTTSCCSRPCEHPPEGLSCGATFSWATIHLMLLFAADRLTGRSNFATRSRTSFFTCMCESEK